MRNDGFTRARAHFFLKMEGLRGPAHNFSEPKGGEDPRRGMLLVRVGFLCFTCPGTTCPRLDGSAFFESGQRDLGVSSKAHKFACELRALLASDKHLRSAERSESEVQGNFQPQTRQRVPEALWRIYRLRHCRRPILVFLEASSRFGDLGFPGGRDSAFGSSEVTNVSRIVALGSSIYCILLGLEAPGRARFRGPSVASGSA